MTNSNLKGRLTLPSEENFYEETLEMLKKLKADAIRDSDGTKLPDEIKEIEDVDIYTTYFTVRDINDFAKDNMDEAIRLYLSSEFKTATSESLTIDLMEDYFDEQIKVDQDCDPKKYWEVRDRTTGEIVDKNDWDIDGNFVKIKTIPFHDYSVSFLAYGIWDPTQMYNYITNDWEDVPHHIPMDIRGEKSGIFVEENLEKWLKENPKTDIVRFTTFFYHFTLVFNKKAMEKYVDWFGYQHTVSPRALDAFEDQYGYRLSPEVFIDEGFYNSIYRRPSKEFLDYIDFQANFVAKRAKRLVDLCHKYGKKAVMFLGDAWIGIEPFGKYFKEIGLDGVVGSVGDGITLRLIADIDTPMKEGRFLPYFFPDTFYEGNDPSIEARDNWIKARRALLRSPLDRIGYGGYLSLAYKFKDFTDYIVSLADEYREIYEKISDKNSYKSAHVAILNSWGELRRWGSHIVAHGKKFKLAYSYMGLMEALSGMDVKISFINFKDLKEKDLSEFDAIINAGDAYTAFSGGEDFKDPEVLEKLRSYVYKGGGFIGLGDPSAYQSEGKFFQLKDVLGLDKEVGFSQGMNKYFTKKECSHFILKDVNDDIDYGEGKENVYAIDEKTKILDFSNESVKMAVKDYGKGRSFYMAGCPYSFQNTRIIKRAIHYVAHKEDKLNQYFSEDIRTEIAAYEGLKEFALINNSKDELKTKFYDKNGKESEISLKPGELKWIKED